METLESHCAHGGVQHVLRHESPIGPMTFALFLPSASRRGPVPLLWFLSGLTCTHENAMTKAGAQAAAEAHGLALCFPDTSPRGEGVPDDAAYDMGQGAGFYLDATQAPWKGRFRMESYVTADLPAALGGFPVDLDRQSVTGHSMGGHGALTLAMRHPGRYRSVSAFAPICNPTRSEWGRRQMEGYLGGLSEAHDAACLMRERGLGAPLLTDTGTDDQFTEHLGTAAFFEAAAARGAQATLRLQPGYDHSYFFVASFAAEHVAFHARHLAA